MTPERFQRVSELFLAAQALPPDDQASFIEIESHGDREIGDEVRALLAADAKPLDLDLGLDAGVRSSVMAIEQSLVGSLAPQVSDAIGPYRLIRKIGEGGMGAVFEAQQETPKRIVAVKVLRGELLSPELTRRFTREANALGQLQHEGIARIFESGTATVGGRTIPFLAMELIQGEMLTDYARVHCLDTRQKLELAAQISDAVNHAHVRGVIHRDLKPSNILVDESGRAKILDFGVARFTGHDAPVATLKTDVGQLIGTISYMSPEQLSGDPDLIDARCDVYSLGIILYELLAGQPPYDVRGRTIADAVLTIRETEPTLLGGVGRSLRGDIETIVAKAIEKDRERRYASAAELAADIRRYLQFEPIVARPASTMYQLGKFARRNRALVGGVATAMVLLIAGITTTSIQMYRARSAESFARAQQSIAEAINQFLIEDVLRGAEVSEDRHNVKLVDALSAAVPKIDARFMNQPQVRAQVKMTMGTMFYSLGRYDEALKQAQVAHDLYRSTLGADHDTTLEVQAQVAACLAALEQPAEAEAVLRSVYNRRRAISGESHRSTLSVLTELGMMLQAQGKFAEAQPLLEALAAQQRKLHGSPRNDLGLTLNALGACLNAQNKTKEVGPVLEETVVETGGRFGADDVNTVIAQHNLASYYARNKRAGDALTIYESLEPALPRLFAPTDYMPGVVMSNHARCLIDLKRFAEAEPLATQAYELLERTLGPSRIETLNANVTLLVLYRKLNKPVEQERVLRRQIRLVKSVRGPDHPGVLDDTEEYAAWLIKQGRPDDAIKRLEPVFAAIAPALPADHPYRRKADKTLAAARAAADKSPATQAVNH